MNMNVDDDKMDILNISDGIPSSSLQRDACSAVEASAAVDRGREEGRRLHRAPPRLAQQPRRGAKTWMSFPIDKYRQSATEGVEFQEVSVQFYYPLSVIYTHFDEHGTAQNFDIVPFSTHRQTY